MKRFLVILFIIYAMGNSFAAPSVDCGALSTDETTYTMNESVHSATNCFNIDGENITLNCDGFSITGEQAGLSYGVSFSSFNATLLNCNISNFSNAVYSLGTTNHKVTNLNATATGYVLNLISTNYTVLNNINATSSSTSAIYLLTRAMYNNISNSIFAGTSNTVMQFRTMRTGALMKRNVIGITG